MGIEDMLSGFTGKMIVYETYRCCGWFVITKVNDAINNGSASSGR